MCNEFVLLHKNNFMMDKKGLKHPHFDYWKETIKGVIVAVTNDYRPNSEGKYNVRFKITFERQRKYIPYKESLSADDWRKLNSTKDKTLIDKRDSIKREFDIIKNHIKDIVEVENKPFSFELLNVRLGRGDKNSVFAAFVDKIETLRKNGRVGTSVSYKDALGSFWRYVNKVSDDVQFSKIYKESDWLNKYTNLTFDQITQSWLEYYVKWLRDNGKTDTTAGIYLRNLRAILNERNIPESKYPFGKDKFVIPEGGGRKIALNKDIISIIDAMQFADSNAAMYRDLWLFSYLCNGANLKDIFRLKYGNIDGNIIHFVRAKTEFTVKKKTSIEAAIHPRMQEIIDRWGNPDKKRTSYIFPFLFDGVTPEEERAIIQDYTKRINRRMDLISKALGLNIKITLYSARHSFAVNSERSGQRTSLISKSLGHKNLKTTIDYLGSFDNEEIIENSNKLL